MKNCEPGFQGKDSQRAYAKKMLGKYAKGGSVKMAMGGPGKMRKGEMNSKGAPC